MNAIGVKSGILKLTNLFRSKADIISNHQFGILRVRGIGSPHDSADDAVRELFRELNQTETIYPGTDLRLVYELPLERRKKRQKSQN